MKSTYQKQLKFDKFKKIKLFSLNNQTNEVTFLFIYSATREGIVIDDDYNKQTYGVRRKLTKKKLRNYKKTQTKKS